MDGMSALHLASESGHGAVCDALLTHNAFVNSKSRVGLTPLHLAAEGGHEDVVKLLLEAGALPQDENKVGRSLIRIKMPIKLPVTLYSSQAGFTAIQLAAKNGHNAVIDVLRDANPETLSYASRKTGLNSLHVAACYGQSGKTNERIPGKKKTVIE